MRPGQGRKPAPGSRLTGSDGHDPLEDASTKAPPSEGKVKAIAAGETLMRHRSGLPGRCNGYSPKQPSSRRFRAFAPWGPPGRHATAPSLSRSNDLGRGFRIVSRLAGRGRDSASLGIAGNKLLAVLFLDVRVKTSRLSGPVSMRREIFNESEASPRGLYPMQNTRTMRRAMPGGQRGSRRFCTQLTNEPPPRGLVAVYRVQPSGPRGTRARGKRADDRQALCRRRRQVGEEPPARRR